ncbi:collagen type IV alpha-3-binding protein [Tetranychus urticae]|uniref:Ceramide transfer protein n=1 Tax=Tetranychus urticae TaxID=32264 RepID=T1L1M9_TETUR|nr:collagen type IV alpha-3-binding protein [Tetranychus urticae]
MTEDQVSLSEDEGLNPNENVTYQGTLNKWTNYIHGWQERFIVLKDGTLTYFKSENETNFGFRGAMCVNKCNVKLHEFDECRFDVSLGDNVWYLRADTADERNRWVEAIEAQKQTDSAYGSDNSLRRHGSALSLGSISVTSFKRGKCLKEKMSELETFRDILTRQVDLLQGYFDACANNPTSIIDSNDAAKDANSPKTNEALEPLNSNKTGNTENDGEKNANQEVVQMSLDFKGETFTTLSLTIKATTTGILATLSHCMDLMQQREENWKKKWETEVEKRKRLEEIVKSLQETSSEAQKMMILNDPDYEEGPHSKIKEEEFFDAVDAMLDRKDQQEEEKRQLKLRVKEIGEPSSSLPEVCDHPLWFEIDKTTLEQLKQARLEVGEGDGESGSWELFAAEGDMRLYKRDLVVDGLVCDPLKAVHTVRGITGHEVCYHFFSPDVRWDWENTLESMKVVEEINPNTLVFHQIHKRVWPAAQRDAVFWSHIRKLNPSQLSPSPASTLSSSSSTSSTFTLPSPSSSEKRDPDDIWIVCNNSTDRSDIPLGRCVRMKMTVSLTCETFIETPKEGQQINRDNLVCKIIYCSTINPGGWAPASVLRALYKREYPKFLKNFTQYVIDARKEKPIMF